MIQNKTKRIIGSGVVLGTILLVGLMASMNVTANTVMSRLVEPKEVISFDGYLGENGYVEYMGKLVKEYPTMSVSKGDLLSDYEKDTVLLYLFTGRDPEGVVLVRFYFTIPNVLFSEKMQTDVENIGKDMNMLLSSQNTQLYMDVNYGGSYTSRTQDAQYIGDYWNDKISSIKSHASGYSSYYWVYCEHIDFAGSHITLYNGTDDPSLVGDNFNDKISSFWFYGT